MGEFNQTIVSPVPTSWGMGSSNSKIMREMFPDSPIYKEEVTNEKCPGGTYIDLLQVGEVPGSGGYYGLTPPFNRDFIGAPDIPDDVLVGAAGLPGTAYVPNPVPPGPGNVNPLDQPAPPPADFWPGGHHDTPANPKITSANISGVTIGHYFRGTSG
jgi:hypothetical protein